MLKKIILIIIVLLVFLGGLGYWYWTRNPYSKDVLKIEILAPDEANFSEEVEYTVKYKNNGNIRLDSPRMVFEYPINTLVGDSFTRRKEVSAEELGDIYPGEEKTYTFKGRLFGKEGELKTATVQLSFQPKNLKARYESATTTVTRIKPIPLTFDFDLPSKIEPNKNFDFSINYYSALDYPLADLTVKVQYPDKFEFVKSKPSSNADKTEWGINLLNKAQGGRIDITGKMAAELGDHKIFNAQLGMWRSDGEFILMKEVSREIEIVQPNLSVFQQINGQNEYIASAGDLLHYEVFFRNLGTEPFTNLFLVVSLSGQGYDFDSVKVTDGKFQKGDNTIVWDWNTISKLKFLDQGEEGKVEFWVNLKDDWNIASYAQKDVVVKDSVLISKIKQEFETKVDSKLSVSSRVVSDGNSDYTLTWQARNSFNNVKNVRVRAVLPQNIRVTGKTTPENSSNFAFDSQSREIVWIVGDMQAGDGVLNNPPTISFQVESTYNQGNMLLLDQIRVTGEDEWTDRAIEEQQEAVRTP